MGSAIKRVANYAVSDTAYGSGWDGVTDVAPSKNAVYDEMELRAPKASPVFTGTVSASEQPSFWAYITSDLTNVTGDGTAYNLTGAIWTETRDIGGCFSNGTFTAPVDGLYLFSGDISMTNCNASDVVLYLITTSAVGNLVIGLRNLANVCNPITGGGHFPYCVKVPMDAGDTANLQIKATFSPASKITDIVGGSHQTKFAGYLLP